MFSFDPELDNFAVSFQPSMMEERPFIGYLDFLENAAPESGGSQETQMSSQGFNALVGDEELFAGIKVEDFDEFFQQPPPPTHAEPVSPVSTASIESMGMVGEVEESLKHAFEASSRKGSLMPLLKEELRCKIQKRRVDAGLDPEPVRQEAPVAGPSQVSEESRRRQEIRKLRNREAAKRCRLKKHGQERELKERARIAEEENRRLKMSVEQNRLSILYLQNALHSHVCTNRPARMASPNL